MDNVTIVDVTDFGQVAQYAIIDKGDGDFISMLKSTYDEMIAKQNEANTL